MDLLTSNNSILHKIILNDHLYIDKASSFFDFVSYLDNMPRYGSANINLIVRPRGFGLSVAIEAIEAMLNYDDLISDSLNKHYKDRQSPKAPVVRLSLNKIKARTTKEFSDALIEMIQMQMWEHHITGTVNTAHSPKACFLNLLKKLYQTHGQSVVVLIDNYDIPYFMAASMQNDIAHEAITIYLDMLNAIKLSGDCVRWCLLGGHVKFDLASELSEGLPLVHDFSYSPLCDTLFGFTKEELKYTYKDVLKKIAPHLGVTVSEYIEALDAIYGGFVFSDRKIKVLCPTSVNAALDNDGMLYPYLAHSDFTFLKEALLYEEPNLEWLFGKDGQDPLFLETISLKPQGKEFGSLLLQLGFVSINKVTKSESDNFINYRYRFDVTNYEMARILKVLQQKASVELLNQAFNPEVYVAGENDFDITHEHA